MHLAPTKLSRKWSLDIFYRDIQSYLPLVENRKIVYKPTNDSQMTNKKNKNKKRFVISMSKKTMTFQKEPEVETSIDPPHGQRSVCS